MVFAWSRTLHHLYPRCTWHSLTSVFVHKACRALLQKIHWYEGDPALHCEYETYMDRQNWSLTKKNVLFATVCLASFAGVASVNVHQLAYVSRAVFGATVTLTRSAEIAISDKQATIINLRSSCPIPSPPVSPARWVGHFSSYRFLPSSVDLHSSSGLCLVRWHPTSGLP